MLLFLLHNYFKGQIILLNKDDRISTTVIKSLTNPLYSDNTTCHLPHPCVPLKCVSSRLHYLQWWIGRGPCAVPKLRHLSSRCRYRGVRARSAAGEISKALQIRIGGNCVRDPGGLSLSAGRGMHLWILVIQLKI